MIRNGGLDIFPRLVAAEHRTNSRQLMPSGNAGLDELLCGGLPIGTSTLLLGPAGTGKSTVALSLRCRPRNAGNEWMFVFDENIGTFRSRSRKLGLPIEG